MYVGRISNEKRLDLMLEVMDKLSGPGAAYLAIIGDGPSAPAFARLHGQENRVYCKPRFLSHAELAEVYASCDVHVSASEFETLGNTVLEAFACGIPVVVPRTQGFRDTVHHERDGFLFNPADVADAARYVVVGTALHYCSFNPVCLCLCAFRYLQRLKDDAELRRGMGAAGQAAVTSRGISHVVADLLQWYERGSQTAARRRKQFFYRLIVPAALSLLVPFTIALFCFYNFTVRERICFS